MTFAKAFDHIDHTILLHKLQLLNTPQLLLNWCAHFLYNRQQRVLFNNVSSSWKHIHSGLPQGTKLGPLFFPSVLQNELNKIVKWSESNSMKINVTKTKELPITFLKNGAPMDRLTVYNQPLDLVPSSKLLGAYVSSDLKWSTHIDYICAKASKRLYALRTLKRSGVQPTDLKSVFCYFIRPLLEYACPIWHSSLTAQLKDQLEDTQRRALRIIYPQMSYNDSLKELNLPTFYERRERRV